MMMLTQTWTGTHADSPLLMRFAARRRLIMIIMPDAFLVTQIAQLAIDWGRGGDERRECLAGSGSDSPAGARARRGEDHEEEDAAWDAEHVRFPLMHPAFPVSHFPFQCRPPHPPPFCDPLSIGSDVLIHLFDPPFESGGIRNKGRTAGSLLHDLMPFICAPHQSQTQPITR
jgi:hypothetical protein